MKNLLLLLAAFPVMSFAADSAKPAASEKPGSVIIKFTDNSKHIFYRDQKKTNSDVFTYETNIDDETVSDIDGYATGIFLKLLHKQKFHETEEGDTRDEVLTVSEKNGKIVFTAQFKFDDQDIDLGDDQTSITVEHSSTEEGPSIKVDPIEIEMKVVAGSWKDLQNGGKLVLTPTAKGFIAKKKYTRALVEKACIASDISTDLQDMSEDAGIKLEMKIGIAKAAVLPVYVVTADKITALHDPFAIVFKITQKK
jgi:hypothetical protein